MLEPPKWHVQPNVQPPEEFVQAVQCYAPELPCQFAAQLLWQRNLQDSSLLAGFLDPQQYQPASPFEFGSEMAQAMERLQQARTHREKIAIWGDFDADGITATAVLWEGLGQFFEQQQQLLYYIPNRLTESHGLSCQGIDVLAQQGCRLIVTCDTGSTNLLEIEYAQQLGIETIVTDHHTLPLERPPAIAIVNPRYLPITHPLFHLSGVAVAYKVVEALYETLPQIPQQPLEHLLDLVAIGLIADLVELKGDCRYLAQRGIERLQLHLRQRSGAVTVAFRPGVARLLELCKRSGDRPTDISFGLGPRINAVSRIQGDASFCVELLSSQDRQRCEQLALETELANARRKSLQREVLQQVEEKLALLDLSTTRLIVLMETQWPVGVLGLVAGQVAQKYGRPTILLSTGSPGTELRPSTTAGKEDRLLARGSARSVNQIDLYQLVKDQAHLLHRFGGHPFAAGLSVLVANIPLFAAAVEQRLQRLEGMNETTFAAVVKADLTVTVADLGRELFRELKLLEPCGMGNPVPQLLICNCWFVNVWNRNIKDSRGRKVQYIKTEFELWDKSTKQGFPGIWWGHYREEIPSGRCDVVVELDFNAYEKRYEVRLQAVRLAVLEGQSDFGKLALDILDWRDEDPGLATAEMESFGVLRHCPGSWDELLSELRQALLMGQRVAIAYSPPTPIPPATVWQQLVGLAKYLSRTGRSATQLQLRQKLGIGDRVLQIGLQSLGQVGFAIAAEAETLQFSRLDATQPWARGNAPEVVAAISPFIAAVREEQFRQQYFSQVPLATIQHRVSQSYQFSLEMQSIKLAEHLPGQTFSNPKSPI